MTRKIFPDTAPAAQAAAPIPLWQQLALVAQGLQMILSGQSGTAAVAAACQ